MHTRRSLLFADDSIWIKSSEDPSFDVTMGSFDGAELCELVGLYILHVLGEKLGKENMGLYRDDGLACFRGVDGPSSDRIRKDIVHLFQEMRLKITIKTNLKIVNFLDVTFNLTTGTYQPYNKPNDRSLYINTKSNHLPSIIKSIPESISRRISKISSTKEIFDAAAPYYNDALSTSGYSENIEYKPNVISHNRNRRRVRNVIWFNPPYSINVKTNIAKRFLNLINKHFPKNHKLHKVFNRNNVKVSYSCLPNIGSTIQAHNKMILSNKKADRAPMCNCRQKDSCPLDGKCLDRNIVYCGNVTVNDLDEGSNYFGVTENTFKDRSYKHRNSFKYDSKANSTELSKYVWDLQKNGTTDYVIKWSIIDHARPYVNGSKKCNLCITEKYHIITSSLNLLNKRSELVSKCRHENKFYLANYKEVPPDIQ